MKKIFAKKTKYSGMVFATIIVLIGVLTVYGIRHTRNVSPANAEVNETEQVKNNQKEIGRMESIIEYGDRITMAIHYPAFDNPTIDEVIHNDLTGIIGGFKEELISSGSDDMGFLHGDYHAYIIDDTHVSVAFTIEKSFSTYANPEMRILNYTFETVTGKRMGLGDVIDSKYMPTFVDMVYAKVSAMENHIDSGQGKQELSDYIYASPYCFVLDKDGLSLRFEKYTILPGSAGLPVVSLPYSEVSKMFQGGFKVGSVLTQPEAQEEQEQQTPEPEGNGIQKVSRNVDPSKPMVALTFDDGPHPENTRKILKALSKHNGAGTFFMLGNRASSYGDVIEEVVAQGSEAGNHSWSHGDYSKKTGGEINADRNKAQEAIGKHAGYKPKSLRVPYGAINDTVKKNVGMPIVLWSVDTNDWKDKKADVIIERATKDVKDGDIILMHDIWPETAAAMPEITKRLTDKGFQLVTISEMATAREVKLKNGTKYFSFHKK